MKAKQQATGEKIVSRESITDETYREVLDVETHHNHEIIQDERGTLRWKENPGVRKMVDEKMNLNDIWRLFFSLGITKNSEIIRKLYRDMGYSLYGYWEVFYWEANNDDAADYVPSAEVLKNNF